MDTFYELQYSNDGENWRRIDGKFNTAEEAEAEVVLAEIVRNVLFKMAPVKYRVVKITTEFVKEVNR